MHVDLYSLWSVLAAIGWGAAGFLACILLLRTQRSPPVDNPEEHTSAPTDDDYVRPTMATPCGKQRSLTSAPCCLHPSSDCCPSVMPHSQDMEKLLRQNR
jgi:hypothetical protein